MRRRSGFSHSRAGSRSPSAPPTVFSIRRAKRWRTRSGPKSRRSPGFRANCRAGRSCASGVRPLPLRPSKMRAVRARRPPGAISSWPATGPIPACRPRSKVRSDPASAPPNSSANTNSRRPLAPMADNCDPALEAPIAAATRALLDRQQPDGHWVFELEADATIPAEYVLLRHYLAEPVDAEIEAKIAAYLRCIQGIHGGWPLFHDGAFDMSASVKAYFALKMIGDPVSAPYMTRACEAIRARGGAARANVFTRVLMALYGFIPWRAVPVMPVEIMLLPKWFPFHIDKISYWSRTVIVPLLVLQAEKPKARNPEGVRIDELV